MDSNGTASTRIYELIEPTSNKIAEIFNMPATELFNRIEGETNFNNCHNFIGYAEHNQTVNVGNQNDLRELVKQNSMLIASLTKRIEYLEQK